MGQHLIRLLQPKLLSYGEQEDNARDYSREVISEWSRDKEGLLRKNAKLYVPAEPALRS